MQENSSFNPRWWEGDVASNVFGISEHLSKTQSYRADGHLKNLRLYGNKESRGLSFDAYSRTNTNDKFVMNVVQGMIDSAVSKISKNKVKVMFLTDGGDHNAQKQGKQLTKFVAGQFYESDAYATAEIVLRDACIFDAGICKVYREGKEIKLERVFPSEIQVDDEDSMDGNPRSMIQSKTLGRDVLIEMFPESKNKLINASSAGDSGSHWRYSPKENIGDRVEVKEAWHLPSGPDSGDGYHTICIGEHELLGEEYKRDYFPFTKITWTKPVVGWWGQGLAEQLSGIQFEINRVLMAMRKSVKFIVPKVFIERGSKVVKSHFNNEIGGMIEFTNTPPQVYTPQPFHMAVMEYLNYLVEKAYQISGISQLSALSLKPAGLNSGRALDTFHDIESERFIYVGRSYEDFFVDLATKMIDLAEEIDADEGGYEVRTHDRKSMQVIKWKDIDLDRDKYVMQAFPTNFLPQSPTGRLKFVEQLAAAGFIGQEDALRLLDFPDTDSVVSKLTAQADYVDMLIENMLDNGKPEYPEPTTDLSYAVKNMTYAIKRAEMSKVPDSNIQLLRDYISEAVRIMNESQEAGPAAPMGAMPGELEGMPPDEAAFEGAMTPQ